MWTLGQSSDSGTGYLMTQVGADGGLLRKGAAGQFLRFHGPRPAVEVLPWPCAAKLVHKIPQAWHVVLPFGLVNVFLPFGLVSVFLPWGLVNVFLHLGLVKILKLFTLIP